MKANAAKIGKRGVLALKERGGKRMRAVMDWEDFVWLYWLARGERE